jgi:hypothetical protein
MATQFLTGDAIAITVNPGVPLPERFHGFCTGAEAGATLGHGWWGDQQQKCNQENGTHNKVEPGYSLSMDDFIPDAKSYGFLAPPLSHASTFSIFELALERQG